MTDDTRAPATALPPSTNSGDAVQALRASTRALHQALDESLPLGKPGATLAHYAAHLRMLKEWQTALQPWLERTATAPESHLLLDLDLADCPAQVLTDPVDPVDPLDLRPLQAADDGSDAFCWGIRYVLEGSRLGGQVLYRQLREPLAPHPLRYLGERAADGTSWRDTLIDLRRLLGTPAQRQAACRGANAAFELLLSRAQPTTTTL